MFPVCCFRKRTNMTQGLVNVVPNATGNHWFLPAVGTHFKIFLSLFEHTTKLYIYIHINLEGVRAKKKIYARILFVYFTKAFESMHRGKMEQILLTNGLTRENIATIMMLYRNTKVKFCSPYGD